MAKYAQANRLEQKNHYAIGKSMSNKTDFNAVDEFKKTLLRLSIAGTNHRMQSTELRIKLLLIAVLWQAVYDIADDCSYVRVRSAYHVFYSSQRLFFAELLEIDLDIFNKTVRKTILSVRPNEPNAVIRKEFRKKKYRKPLVNAKSDVVQ